MSDIRGSIAQSLKSRILKYFPDLNIESSVLIDTGWDNYVLIVNRQFVFRFPKDKDQQPKILTEINLLSFLNDFPFKIPRYTFIVNKEDIFGGYRIIDGVPLNSAKRISGSLVNDFVTLFSYMWKIGPTECSKTEISVYSRENWLNHEIELIRSFSINLSKYIPLDFFNSLEELASDILSDIDEKEIRLIHGDLYRNNVLITHNMNNISGIIDWSDASIGDIALDLAAVSVDFKLSDIAPIFRSLNSICSSRIFRRIGFYRVVEPLYRAHYFSRSGETVKALKISDRIYASWQDDMEFRNIYNINDVKDLWHTKQR